MSDWDPPEDPTFARKAGAILEGVFRDGAEDAIDRFKLGVDYDFALPDALAYGEERGAELIGMKWVDGELVPNPAAEWVIDDFTRERANELLGKALEEGWSYEKLSARLEEADLFGEARADLIARNEISLAQVGGATRSYREAGVEQVRIFDGDYDDECAARDGTVVDIDEWEAEPFLHPSCTADAVPLTREEQAEEDDSEEKSVKAHNSFATAFLRVMKAA